MGVIVSNCRETGTEWVSVSTEATRDTPLKTRDEVTPH